ncbi:MAG: PRC-barrel domain-containing protein [Thermoleophilia bacterium]|nr:PRC-barrel domain-containing protein [Thermoleophilia bacterium]
MRASELLSCDVVDASGAPLGPVRDVRITADGFRAAGIVVGGGALAAVAHAWGYPEGRARGPALLTTLFRHAIRAARFVPAEDVARWGPGTVELAVEAAALRPLAHELA